MTYDLIIVGTGFASSFFLLRALELLPGTARILVLERGARDNHGWRISNRKTSSTPEEIYTSSDKEHDWVNTIGFGGGSNCWWACTPRMMPSDFELRRRYGRGRNWPFDYEDLEPHYEAVESVMSISGGETAYPRRSPHPHPPHRFNAVDRILKEAHPTTYFHQPTARARKATGRRNACRANSICHLCPIQAKFSIQNEMAHLYEDPRVEMRLKARVVGVDIEASMARGVRYIDENGREQLVKGDLVALGGNPINNVNIMQRSSLNGPMMGRGINEQHGLVASVDYDGPESLDGSTSITGHSYLFYDGDFRKERGATLAENYNTPQILRPERGRWRNRAEFVFIIENEVRNEDRILLDPSAPDKAVVQWSGHSDYALRSEAYLKENIMSLVAPLNVERIVWRERATEAHIQGGHLMGADSADSVVDHTQRHHSVRNLLALGAGSFPTCIPANPTLTLSAMSLRSADALFSRGA